VSSGIFTPLDSTLGSPAILKIYNGNLDELKLVLNELIKKGENNKKIAVAKEDVRDAKELQIYRYEETVAGEKTHEWFPRRFPTIFFKVDAIKDGKKIIGIAQEQYPLTAQEYLDAAYVEGKGPESLCFMLKGIKNLVEEVNSKDGIKIYHGDAKPENIGINADGKFAFFDLEHIRIEDSKRNYSMKYSQFNSNNGFVHRDLFQTCQFMKRWGATDEQTLPEDLLGTLKDIPVGDELQTEFYTKKYATKNETELRYHYLNDTDNFKVITTATAAMIAFIDGCNAVGALTIEDAIKTKSVIFGKYVRRATNIFNDAVGSPGNRIKFREANRAILFAEKISRRFNKKDLPDSFSRLEDLRILADTAIREAHKAGLLAPPGEVLPRPNVSFWPAHVVEAARARLAARNIPAPVAGSSRKADPTGTTGYGGRGDATRGGAGGPPQGRGGYRKTKRNKRTKRTKRTKKSRKLRLRHTRRRQITRAHRRRPTQLNIVRRTQRRRPQRQVLH